MEHKMAKETRRKHSSAFKAKVALAAMAGDKSLITCPAEAPVLCLSRNLDMPILEISGYKTNILSKKEKYYGN